MKKFRLASSAAVAILGLQPFMIGHADTANSIAEMLSEGDTSLSFRYRYEFVDQDGVAEDANASTLKSRLTYKSASYNGLTALMEVDNVTVIGDENYRTPTNGNVGYPIVADPDGTDFNQASLSYTTDDISATLGRQRILHGGQRFVGGVGFRQNEQTYDALTLSSKAADSVSVNYSYIWNVNRIFGPKDSTVVFYMGLSNLEEITSQLLQRGCPADKPFAIVAQGTSNDQQVVLGTISDIAERVKAMPLPSPALLMMGDVIKANGYAQQLADQTLASYPVIAQA
ncbi:hypothetical protein N9B97_03240 [Porticoccaceae bacterium]|nr:hypothetical protein [Porticoccaceae bacterium]